MNHPRKRTSFVLAILLVFAMTATAYAADGSSMGQTGTITVENPIGGQNYTAYKIFDVTYNGESYAYTLPFDSQWYTTVSAFAATEGSGLTLTKATDESQGLIYVVTIDNTAFHAASFAAALKSAQEGKTGSPLSGEKPTAENLELGYYFVSSTNGALCNLTTTDPTANIYDKNDIPFEKTDNAADVEVGQTVNYTITGKVPDTTGFTTYTYRISDTMSDGLTFNSDVTVSVDGTVLTENFTLTPTSNGFTLDISVMELQSFVAKTITVTYSATVNENAIAQVEINRATLTYSNDPTDEEAFTTTPPDEESVFSAAILINKVNEQDEKLANAKFVLYKEVPQGESTEKHYYFYNAETESVSWIPLSDSELRDALKDASITQVITDEDGSASFGGLANGTYYLLETEAPDGYNRLTDSVSVTINNTEQVQTLSVTAEVENKTGSVLPETGGMGTSLFYGCGIFLVGLAAVLLIARKRLHNL